MNPTMRIQGVQLRPLREIPDERGAVLHMIRGDSPDFVRFGECYFSEVASGAVKAWKRHREQTQNLAVPVGRVRFAIFDDRVDSPTRGVLEVLELGRPGAYALLVIPPGLWYGFEGADSRTSLIANCADLPHDPAESERRPHDDPAIPHTWGGFSGGPSR